MHAQSSVTYVVIPAGLPEAISFAEEQAEAQIMKWVTIMPVGYHHVLGKVTGAFCELRQSSKVGGRR